MQEAASICHQRQITQQSRQETGDTQYCTDQTVMHYVLKVCVVIS